MKTKSLFLAALVIMSAVISVVGKDEPKKAGLAIVPVKNTEVFKVIYKGENAGRVKLNIFNDKGENIFSESLSSDGFIRPLNFSGLQSGEYTVELTDATGTKVEKISYRTAAKSVKNVHISRIANEDSKYLVSVGTPGAGEVTVNIYNSADELIHSETRVVTGEFAQVYAVKNSASVTFEVIDQAGNTKVVRY